MDLKPYNECQAEIFSKYKIWESVNFYRACCIVSQFREIGNKEYFVRQATKALYLSHIIDLSTTGGETHVI